MMHIEACLRIRDKTITSFSGQGGIKGMASNREYLDFILEQLSGLANITYRAMMGEFILRMTHKPLYQGHLLHPLGFVLV